MQHAFAEVTVREAMPGAQGTLNNQHIYGKSFWQ